MCPEREPGETCDRLWWGYTLSATCFWKKVAWGFPRPDPGGNRCGAACCSKREQRLRRARPASGSYLGRPS